MKHFPLTFKILSLLAFSFPFSTLEAQQKPPAKTIEETSASYISKVIEGAKGTFGYDIYVNGRLLIHQPSIPAMPGNKGFKTKAAAENVTRLVIEKLKRGEMPPTISVDELKKLKAL